MDSATSTLKRPSMARVQVELDLLKERPDRLWIATEGEDGFWQKIDYEAVPEYCQHCWHIGHSQALCHVFHPELRKQVTSTGAPPLQSQKYVPKSCPPVDHPKVSSGALPLVPQLSQHLVPVPPILLDPSSSHGPLPVDVDVPGLHPPAPTALDTHVPENPLHEVLISKEIGFTSSEVVFSPTRSAAIPGATNLSDSEEENIVIEDDHTVVEGAQAYPMLELSVSNFPLFESRAQDDLAVGRALESHLSFPFRSEVKSDKAQNATREQIDEQLKEFSTHLQSFSFAPSQVDPLLPAEKVDAPLTQDESLPKRNRPQKGFYLQLSQPQYSSHAMQLRSTKPSRSTVSND